MAEMKIGNTTIDTLNHKELHESLSKTQANWFQEMARGIKPIQMPTAIGTVASTNVTIPSVGGTAVGPRPGFTWTVQRLSCPNLSTNDVLKIYRGTVNDMNYVGQLTNSSPVLFPGDTGLILQNGASLVFSGTGLTATGDIVVTGEVIEVATADVWKLLGN